MSEFLIALAIVAHYLGTILTYATAGSLGALFLLGLRQIHRSARLDLGKRVQR